MNWTPAHVAGHTAAEPVQDSEPEMRVARTSLAEREPPAPAYRECPAVRMWLSTDS